MVRTSSRPVQPVDLGGCRPVQPVDLGGCRPVQPVDLGGCKPVQPEDKGGGAFATGIVVGEPSCLVTHVLGMGWAECH